MNTIVVAAQKGGVGKTTIVSHLAVVMAKRGHKTWILDTDPQASLTVWRQAREVEATEDPRLVTIPNLTHLSHLQAKAKAEGVKFLFIDTPPANEKITAMTIGAASFVIIPLNATPRDLRAIGSTLELTQAAKKPFAFALNRVKHRATLTGEAVSVLAEHGEVAPQAIADRTVIAASDGYGQTANDVSPSSAGAMEFDRLADYLIGRLKRK